MVFAAVACTAETTAPPDYAVAVDRELDITLGTAGPGPAYDTIPQISSSAVRFLGVSEPPELRNPGGPTQVFRFEAQTPGWAAITFRRSASDSRTVVVEVQ